MTNPLYIFDLDGTLADLKHRRHFVALQDGSVVTSRHFDKGIYRGPHATIADNCWIEIAGTGQWAFHNSDVKFKPNWDAFHAACVDDTPIKSVIVLLETLAQHADIWVWSGRMETVYAETLAWLYHNIDFQDRTVGEVLKMRPAGDYTVDHKLKESWLHAMSPEDRARLVCVFDDRNQVVDMWRRNGVVCCQVAPGDF